MGFLPLPTKAETEEVDDHSDRSPADIFRIPEVTVGDDEYIPKFAPITRRDDVPVTGTPGKLDELAEIVGPAYIHTLVKLLVTSDNPVTMTLIEVGIFPGATLQAREVNDRQDDTRQAVCAGMAPLEMTLCLAVSAALVAKFNPKIVTDTAPVLGRTRPGLRCKEET